MLLIGIGGSGRQSLSRIASYMCELATFQIAVTKHYRLPEFREDLKILYSKTGVENKPTTFLFVDTQVIEEQFLEVINSILSTGEVTSLFKADEMEEVRDSTLLITISFSFQNFPPIFRCTIPFHFTFINVYHITNNSEQKYKRGRTCRIARKNSGGKKYLDRGYTRIHINRAFSAQIKSKLTKEATRLGRIPTTETIYALLIERARANMHLVVCMSPIGDAFRNRLRQYPALINCTTIDWFLEWPREALLEVGNKFLMNLNLTLTITGETKPVGPWTSGPLPADRFHSIPIFSGIHETLEKEREG